MTRLPVAIDDGLRRLEALTDRLASALERDDAEAIAIALDERGRAIDELRRHLTLPARLEQRALLRSRVTAVVEHGATVLRGLQVRQSKTAKILASLVRESTALRAYGNVLPAAAALDRSG